MLSLQRHLSPSLTVGVHSGNKEEGLQGKGQTSKEGGQREQVFMGVPLVSQREVNTASQRERLEIARCVCVDKAPCLAIKMSMGTKNTECPVGTILSRAITLLGTPCHCSFRGSLHRQAQVQG